jgi:hypothetical protein
VARVMLCVFFLSGAAAARDPDPTIRIPLEPMGFQSILPEFLLSGNSMLTVNFVDDDHLLVTFGLRRLMKRDPDDPPNDDDRTVGAALVELPSGKVIAKTQWRLHDRGQYLWALGHGRFLLRVRDNLTMIAPLAEPPENAFRETPFLHNERHLLAMIVSADDDLLTIETADRQAQNSAHFSGDSQDTNPAPVQINFYRLFSKGPAADQLVVASAGVLRARTALALPLTSAGFLDVLEGGPNRWLFNFDTHAGKVSELAEFDTTCYPRTTFVSHSEFIAFGCRGGADKQDIAGFNLHGDAMWQQNFYESQLSPTFSFAPSVGRFAMGRTIVNAPLDSFSLLSSGAATAQEVRVYQMYSGKQLFRTQCTPIVRAGQNFALSPDGMRLAVLRETVVQHKATKEEEAYTSRETAVEVYALPELSDKDKAAVREAQGYAPEDTGARIDLALHRETGHAADTADSSAPGKPAAAKPGASGPAATQVSGGNSAAASQASLPVADAPRTVDDVPPPPNPAAWGDAPPDDARKPPTLYSPGETPGKQQ